MLKPGFLLGLWLYVAAAAAQPCLFSVRGTVSDAETGERLAFAHVLLQGSAVGNPYFVQATAEGSFALEGICAGTYELRITHIGCGPHVSTLTIDADTVLHLSVEHRHHLLEAYVVEAALPQSPTLTRMEVRGAALDALAGKQVAELAALLPGMRTQQTGNTVAKPVFRGLQGNRVMLLTNGIRQEGQYWGGDHAPEIDSFLATSVAVVEGVDALRYAPDAIGGVVLIESPSVFGESRPIGGEVLTALQSNGRGGAASLAVGGKPFGKWPLYYRVQASAKGLGNIKTADTWLTNTGVRERNFSYALGYHSKRWKVETFYSLFNQEFGLYRYSHLGNLTDLAEVLQGRPAPDTSGFSYRIDRPRQEVLHELWKSSVQYELHGSNKVELTYARQYNSRSEYDVHVGFNPSAATLSRPQLDYGLTTHLGEAIWHYEKGHLSGNVGATGLWRRNNFRGRNFMPSYRNSQVGVFFTQLAALNAWKMQYGARYDWYHADVYTPVATVEAPLQLRFNGLAGGVAARRSLAGGELTLSMASQWRQPAINELFSRGLHHGAGGIEEGNASLQPERAYTFSAGWQRLQGHHHLQAVGYVIYIADFIFLDPTTIELTIRGAFPRYDYRQANALYRGVDVRYTYRPAKGVQAEGAASLLWADNLSKSTFFIGIPAHRFDAGLYYAFANKGRIASLFVGVRGSYTLRQYREPGLFPFEAAFGASPAPTLPPSFDFAPAPDAYFLLGLEAGVGMGRSQLSVSVENALNAAYRDYMNRFRYYADEPGRNIFLRFKHSF